MRGSKHRMTIVRENMCIVWEQMQILVIGEEAAALLWNAVATMLVI